MKIKSLLTASLCALGIFSMAGCSSSKNYTLPPKSDYQGYRIIDGVDKDTIFAQVNLDDNDKIAVAVRDIATTAYSYLEPRYMNSMVTYDGRSKCCESFSSQGLMGGAGLVVYKFSFIGRGTTQIHLVARHKGLSAIANEFDTDHVVTINVNVK